MHHSRLMAQAGLALINSLEPVALPKGRFALHGFSLLKNRAVIERSMLGIDPALNEKPIVLITAFDTLPKAERFIRIQPVERKVSEVPTTSRAFVVARTDDLPQLKADLQCAVRKSPVPNNKIVRLTYLHPVPTDDNQDPGRFGTTITRSSSEIIDGFAAGVHRIISSGQMPSRISLALNSTSIEVSEPIILVRNRSHRLRTA
jgi:hypothetical protein